VSAPRSARRASRVTVLLGLVALAATVAFFTFGTGDPQELGTSDDVEQARAARRELVRTIVAVYALSAVGSLATALWARRRGEADYRSALVIAVVACLPLALLLAGFLIYALA